LTIELQAPLNIGKILDQTIFLVGLIQFIEKEANSEDRRRETTEQLKKAREELKKILV